MTAGPAPLPRDPVVTADVLRRFGEALLAGGVVTQDVLREAYDAGHRSAFLLATALVQRGVPAEVLTGALARASGLQRPPHDVLNMAVAAGVPRDLVEQFQVFGGVPFARRDGRLCVAYVDPEGALQAHANGAPTHLSFLLSPEELRALQVALGVAHVGNLDATVLPSAAPPVVPASHALQPAAAMQETQLASSSHVAAASAPRQHTEVRVPALAGFSMGPLVGKGGMAEVFDGRETATGRRVAIKRIMGNVAGNAELAGRFVREARNTKALRHPDIVEMLAYGELDGAWCLVTEFMDGGTLQDLLARTGPMPSGVAAVLFSHVLAGLAAAHAGGVVHRDLKPANVLLSRAGAVKLTDFGLSRSVDDATMTQTHAVMGTPAYMSPEQLAGTPGDRRSDLFAAGIILHELITGANPFLVPDNPSAMLRRIIDVDFDPAVSVQPNVDLLLEAAVEALLQKDPAARAGSAQDVLDALAPLVRATEARHPDLLARLLEQPAQVVARIRAEEAQAAFERARTLHADGRAAAATLALHAALHDAPGLAQARHAYDALCAAGPFRPGAAPSANLAQAVEAASVRPPAAGPLKRAADVARAEGDLHRAGIYLRRYLRLRPSDTMAATQLADLLGRAPPAQALAGAAGPSLGSTTLALVAGIRTGGFRGGGDAATGMVVRAQPVPVDQAPPPPREEPVEDVPPVAEQLRRWVSANRRALVAVALVGGVLAMGARMTGRFIQGSVKLVDKGFKTDPLEAAVEDPGSMFGGMNPRALQEQGDQELAGGQHAVALRTYERALAAQPNKEVRWRAGLGRARALVALGRADEGRAAARALLEDIPRADPLHAQARAVVDAP